MKYHVVGGSSFVIRFIFSAKQSVTEKDLPESTITLSREKEKKRERERERERENRRDVFLGYLTYEIDTRIPVPVPLRAKCSKTLSRRGINVTAQLLSLFRRRIVRSLCDASFNHSNFPIWKKVCASSKGRKEEREKEQLTLKNGKIIFYESYASKPKWYTFRAQFPPTGTIFIPVF